MAEANEQTPLLLGDKSLEKDTPNPGGNTPTGSKAGSPNTSQPGNSRASSTGSDGHAAAAAADTSLKQEAAGTDQAKGSTTQEGAVAQAKGSQTQAAGTSTDPTSQAEMKPESSSVPVLRPEAPPQAQAPPQAPAPPPSPGSDPPSSPSDNTRVNSGGSSKSSTISAIVLVSILMLAVGFVAGWFGRMEADKVKHGRMEADKVKHEHDDSANTRELLLKEINAEKIKEYLKRFTSYPHLAGTEGERKLADDIEAIWKEQKLDHVTQEMYDVLLSYPNASNPSVVELLDNTDNVLFRSQIQEKNLTADQNNPNIVIPYGSHSPAGDVQGPLVYVNYGRIEDFQRLRDEFNINCAGMIAIVKYGKIFRGDKVMFAAQFGCAGVIIYSDPADFNLGRGAPFPHSWWLPDTGVQRGAMYTLKGDPLTPGYPSIESAYRWPENETEGLPQIPVHPICYGDARRLLVDLLGPDAPQDWRGGLNITYKIGGAMQYQRSVHLKVTTSNRQANTSNVFAFITGSVEPDRYVVMGNHRDAWVFGGIDPQSGTAVMMEVSRAFSALLRRGWRPRRTIVFCSWGAEEPGLIGSTEWVENYIKNLGSRAVIYINVDSAVRGNSTFKPSGVPLLHEALYEVAKEIKSPNDPEQTIYDEWLRVLPDAQNSKPEISALGAGSDHAAFINMAGVSSVDLGYSYDPKLGLSSTPCYHSAYETFFLFDSFVDPDYKYSHAMGQLLAEMIREFADTRLLGMNVTSYYDTLAEYTNTLERTRGKKLNDHGLYLDDLKESVDIFGDRARKFESSLQQVQTTDELALRRVNDQMMQVERAFLDPHGVPQQPIYRHLISAPSKFNSYSGSAFPGLENLLFDVDTVPDPAKRWAEIKRHLATLVFTIQSAASTLAPMEEFQFNAAAEAK